MGLPKHKRLRKAADFRRTMRQGLRLGGHAFVLFAREAAAGTSRLGLSVGRQVGNAVVRNRLKRRLREVFRQPPPNEAQMDVVVVARAEAARISQTELAAELWRRLGQISQRRSRARR